jgi:hypothetical protein
MDWGIWSLWLANFQMSLRDNGDFRNAIIVVPLGHRCKPKTVWTAAGSAAPRRFHIIRDIHRTKSGVAATALPPHSKTVIFRQGAAGGIAPWSGDCEFRLAERGSGIQLACPLP